MLALGHGFAVLMHEQIFMDQLSKYRWLLLVIAIGISLRLVVAGRGHNYDVDSFMLVAEIARRGGNVYAETTRYNYGPIWFNIVAIISRISSFFSNNQAIIFRYLLAGFLSFVDVCIFFVLWRKASRTAAYLFFLNPISIIVTGYHSQFDNLAILLGLLSVIMIGDSTTQPLNLSKVVGLLVLGFSLMTKHVFFMFPFWLAIKQRRLVHKITVAIVPVIIFLLGFIPYWQVGQQGIIQNVFMYKSLDQQYFFRLFIPRIVSQIIDAYKLWLMLLVIFAIIFRPKSVFDSLLLYTGVFLAAAPSIANQYLTIVIPFIAVYPNIFFFLYTVIGTLHLLVDGAGLHISTLRSIIMISPDTYSIFLISLLCLGFLWHIWGGDVLTLAKKGLLKARILVKNE